MVVRLDERNNLLGCILRQLQLLPMLVAVMAVSMRVAVPCCCSPAGPRHATGLGRRQLNLDCVNYHLHCCGG